MADILLDGTNSVLKSAAKLKGNLSALAFGRLSKSVAGSSDVTLSNIEYDSSIIELTGALTGNINLILPLTDGALWEVYNNTTGAFFLTVKGATGTGVVVVQGRRRRIYCDGTNIVATGPHDQETQNAISMTADANKTLTTAEAEGDTLNVTSTLSLTATRDIIVPLTSNGGKRTWIVWNGTTGAQAIRVIGASGTGIIIATAKRAIVQSDATNIQRITADV